MNDGQMKREISILFNTIDVARSFQRAALDVLQYANNAPACLKPGTVESIRADAQASYDNWRDSERQARLKLSDMDIIPLGSAS